ncbi:MAG: beta-propeller fold lactonase family protein [Steroidobacteraceae bacterium]
MNIAKGLWLLPIGLLAACGDGNESSSSAPAMYSVSVTVSGLTGTGLVLQNNGSSDLAISSNGAATFATQIANGTAYNVTVKSQPVAEPAQLCDLVNNNGKINNAAVTNIEIKCRTATGKFLFAVEHYGAIDIYSIDASTGALSQAPFSFRIDEQLVAAYANASFLYVLKGGHYLSHSGMYGTNPTVSVLAIDSNTGGLTEVSGSPYSAGDYWPPDELVFHPSKKFAYAINGSQVRGYSIDSVTGQFTATPGSPYSVSPAGSIGYGGATFTSNGRYLHIVRAGAVDTFSVDDATGALILASSVIYNGNSATQPVLSKAGNFLYFGYTTSTYKRAPVDVSYSQWLTAYSVDSSTGNLSAVAGVPYNIYNSGYTLSPLAIHRSGEYIYLFSSVSSEPGSISVFASDNNTGQLSAIPNSPFATGGNGFSISPTGKFLMVGYTDTNKGINVFGIDAATGTLTATTPSAPTVSGVSPSKIAFDPSGNFVYVLDMPYPGKIYVFSIDAETGMMTSVNSYPTQAESIVISGLQ